MDVLEQWNLHCYVCKNRVLDECRCEGLYMCKRCDMCISAESVGIHYEELHEETIDENRCIHAYGGKLPVIVAELRSKRQYWVAEARRLAFDTSDIVWWIDFETRFDEHRNRQHLQRGLMLDADHSSTVCQTSFG